MNRRWFLKGALGAAAGVAISGELIEALAPRPKIFLPPRPKIFLPPRMRSDALTVGDIVTFRHVTDGPGGPPKWFVVVDGGQVAQYAVRR